MTAPMRAVPDMLIPLSDVAECRMRSAVPSAGRPRSAVVLNEVALEVVRQGVRHSAPLSRPSILRRRREDRVDVRERAVARRAEATERTHKSRRGRSLSRYRHEPGDVRVQGDGGVVGHPRIRVDPAPRVAGPHWRWSALSWRPAPRVWSGPWHLA